MVTCIRCQANVPDDQADFSADGMLCRNCAAFGGGAAPDVAELERSLGRATARKHTILGVCGLVGGIITVAFTGGGDVIVVPVGIILAGAVELARGLAGFSAHPPAKVKASR